MEVLIIGKAQSALNTTPLSHYNLKALQWGGFTKLLSWIHEMVNIVKSNCNFSTYYGPLIDSSIPAATFNIATLCHVESMELKNEAM